MANIDGFSGECYPLTLVMKEHVYPFKNIYPPPPNVWKDELIESTLIYFDLHSFEHIMCLLLFACKFVCISFTLPGIQEVEL